MDKEIRNTDEETTEQQSEAEKRKEDFSVFFFDLLAEMRY